MSDGPGNETLKASLSQRHLSMIALGGVIGAGLFVGSKTIIAAAGPAAILTYVMTGVLIVLIMRMLAEMSAGSPRTGSFADYARLGLGDWAGFSVGWLYWYFWVIVVAFEAIAGATIVNDLLSSLAPGVPQLNPLIVAVVLVVALAATNMLSVRSYGEFEYWFASIKVVTIIAFLALGVAFVVGLWPGAHADVSNLWSHGGFAPQGWGAAFGGVVTVVFSMVGTEVVTIAAAESEDPRKAVIKAMNSVIARIMIFYVGSIALIVTILPWDEIKDTSPYVAALGRLGIPHTTDIMNVVVLAAVLSCLNSGMYTASRMMLTLARNGEAPAILGRIDRRGVPMASILVGLVVALVFVGAGIFSKDGIFAFLLNSSGAVMLFVYLIITFSQIRLRKTFEEHHDGELPVKMWLFPYLSYASAVGIVVVLVMMTQDADGRSQLTLSLVSFAVILVAYFVQRSVGGGSKRSSVDDLSTVDAGSDARR